MQIFQFKILQLPQVYMPYTTARESKKKRKKELPQVPSHQKASADVEE